jgi:hypothetical protein
MATLHGEIGLTSGFLGFSLFVFGMGSTMGVNKSWWA